MANPNSLPTYAETFVRRVGEVDTICNQIARGNVARATTVKQRELASAVRQWRAQLRYNPLADHSSAWTLNFPDKTFVSPDAKLLPVLRKVLPH